MFCFNSEFIKTKRPKRTQTVREEKDLLWFLEAFFSNTNYSLWNQQATLLDFYFVKTLKSWMNTNQDNNNPCKILANSQQITAIHKFLYKSHNSKTNNSENLSWLQKNHQKFCALSMELTVLCHWESTRTCIKRVW